LFGDDQEIEDIVLHKENDTEKVKSIKFSHKGDKSQKEEDNIQKDNSPNKSNETVTKNVTNECF
jgi:hypothetical protein